MVSADPARRFFVPYFGRQAVISDIDAPGDRRSQRGRMLRNGPAGAQNVAITDIAKTSGPFADRDEGRKTAGAGVDAACFWRRLGSKRRVFPKRAGVGRAHTMNKIILADSQAIFRAGTAKVLAMDEDLRIIAQCTDLERMYHAITTFPQLDCPVCGFAATGFHAAGHAA